MSQTDTLVAIATGQGKGGIGIVRLSGNNALSIAQSLTGKEKFIPRQATFCSFRNTNREVLDTGLVIYFPAPHSFTGEDVVELQGHGGVVVLSLLVSACVAAGARQAGPGEFSQRAFLNDKMDLVQAEAIADLIDAGTVSAARAAQQSLQGAFSDEVEKLVAALIALRVEVEAAIDFPEEEIDFLAESNVKKKLVALILQVETVRGTAQQGRLLRDGIKVVLAGRPNAGKSSLLNALCGHETAIVTNRPGTTRDLLHATIQLDGIPLHLVDTAGLRDSDDEIEVEGIRRARNAASEADVILLIVDASADQKGEKAFQQLLAEIVSCNKKQNIVGIFNKADVSDMPINSWVTDAGEICFSLSAKTGEGVGALRMHLKTMAGWQGERSTPFSARQRHLDALDKCLKKLTAGKENLVQHHAGELLAEDLREAQQALEEITGAFTADDLLGQIFSSFCIGK